MDYDTHLISQATETIRDATARIRAYEALVKVQMTLIESTMAENIRLQAGIDLALMGINKAINMAKRR